MPIISRVVTTLHSAMLCFFAAFHSPQPQTKEVKSYESCIQNRLEQGQTCFNGCQRVHFVRSEGGGLKSGAKLIVGSVLLCSAFASHALTDTKVSWTAESDIPADGYGFVGHYVQHSNRYINSGSGTITETVLINGRNDNNSVLGAGIETRENLTLDFNETEVSSWTEAHAYVEYMGRIYAGTGQTATEAEATYNSTEVKNNPSLTVQSGSIVLIGSAATGSDNGDGGNSAIFTYYSKSGKQNASRRSTIGALGDVLFKSNSKLTMGSGSHLLSQTGKIEFTDSSLVVDEDKEPLHPFSGNSSEKANIIIWSHGAITAKSAANYVNATKTGIWIESHYGDIDWQGQEFNARLNSGIWNRSGNVSLVTLKQAGDNSHNSGAISLTGGSVEAAYGEKNGQVKLAANGTLNTSGIALNNTKVLGNAVILAANAGLMGTDDQALESLLNRDNNILNLSNGAHIGKLGATGETQDSSEQATESLTIYADAVLNDRSGGEAENITVKGGVSLDETTAGTYASHLIAQNKLDIDASGKDVSIQNGAYLQTTGTDEAGITIKADKVNMGTTGNKIGSSISTGGSSVSVTAGSISMGTGSQLGNESTGSVELTSSSITLNSDSHINSSDEVKIVASEGNNLSISMDQTNVGSNASSIKGNKVTIGDDQNASQLTLTGGSIQSTSTDADNGVNINFSSGKDGDSSISGTQIGSGSEVVKIAGTGNLNLTNLTNDEKTPTIVNGASVSIDVNDGNLAIVGANDGESANNTHIIGGTIELSANKVSLDDQGWIQSDSSGSLTVTTPELALGGGAHIGTGTLDGASQEGGNVTVNTNKVSLDAGSYITSQGAVNITPSEGSEGGLTIDMTPSAGGGVDGWIKGGSVTVGSVDQVGGTSIEGGSIAGSGGSVTIAGGSSKDGDNSGVVINESTVSTGAGGSVKIEAVGGAPIQIGTENAAGDTINKDTQIIGGNITIGSADGTVNNPISVSDAVIGTVGEAGNGDITINAGTGQVNVSGSTVGTGSQSSTASNRVEITGGEVTIGSSSGQGAGDENAFDTAIGGSNITIGNTETGSVSIGDAQIGTATEDDKAGSNVTINAGSDDTLGSITIGSANSTGESVINGGNVTIGAGSSNAGITINGSRAEAEENASSTGITGDKVVIGNGKGDVSVSDSDIASTGKGDAGGITIEAGDEADLVISDALLDSTGGLAGGTDQFGKGDATGNVTIIGGGSIAGSGIAAGGNVNFGDSTSEGNKNDHIVNVTGGSSISGNGMSVAGDTTVNLGGAEGTDKGNSVNIAGEGEVTVEGELNIAGDNNIKSEGDLTINTGTTGSGTVNVAEGGSITAGANGEGETGNTGDMTITGNGTVNVAGGKLEANGDDEGVGGNVNVTGADVNLSTGEDGTAGSIVADGFVTVGGEDSNGQDLGGSINVDAGETGVIIAGGDDGSGNNVVVGNGGQLNVANDGTPEGQGSLIISKDESVEKPDQGGLHIDTDTTVSVGEGGFVVSDNISFGTDNEGNTSGKLEVEAGGGIHTSADSILENTNKGDGAGLVIGNNSTVQVSGAVDEDKVGELDSILNDGKDNGDKVTIILDEISGVSEDTVISEDQLTSDSTTADGKPGYHGAVVGDAMIDVSGAGNNDLSEGGGGSILVDYKENPNGGEPNGTLTVDGNVTITGSTTNPDREIVAGAADSNGDGKTDSAQTNGKFDIMLEDGADLTLGKDGAAGGTLSGSITATTSDGNENKPSDVTVNGGNFTVEGGIDLTHPDADGNNTSADDDGDIIIRDHNTTNPDAENGLTVAGDVAAGDLVMGGGDTNLDVGGDLSLSGSASLTGNADVDVAGSITVDDVLDMSGTSSLGKDHAASDAADEGTEGNLTVGGLDITDSASIDRNDVDVNGNAHINGTGTSNVGGDFTIDGSLAIGTGKDYNNEATNAGDATVNVNGGNLVTGTDEEGSGNGDLIIGQGNVNVEGATGSPDEGNITVGANGTGGNLVVGNNGTMPKIPADVSADNNITVENGSATIHDNGHVTAGGAFEVGVGDGSTTVEGAGNATIEGTLSAGTADIGNDLVIGAEVADGAQAPAQNGSVTTSGKTDVAGNLIVNENGQLSVGSNPTGGDDGRLTVGGYVDTEAGSNVVANNGLTVGSTSNIGGTLTIGGTSAEDKPNAEFNGDLTVEASGSLNNTAVVDGTTDTVVSGNLTVGSSAEGAQQATANLGDAEVAGTTTVDNGKVTSGDFTGKGETTISGAGTSFDATGNITLTGSEGAAQPNLIIKDGASVSASAQEGGASKGDVTVGGFASVTTGSLTADGKLTISGTDSESGNGLVVGNQNAQPNEDGTYDKTTNVTVGSIEVTGPTQVYGDGTLAVNGDALFTGGLAMGAGANYVNNSDKATTVGGKDGGFTLDVGASVTTNGAFAFGEGIGNQVGTSDAETSGTLNGTITAGSIDFSEYKDENTGNTITFAGGENAAGAAGDASRFEAGFEANSLTGNVALENGANAVLAPQTAADGSVVLPTLNGWLTVNAGKKDADGTITEYGNTLATNAANKGQYANSDVGSNSGTSAVLNMDSSIVFGPNSGLLMGEVPADVDTSKLDTGVYFYANSSMVLNAANMASGTTLFETADGSAPVFVAQGNELSINMAGWGLGTDGFISMPVSEDSLGTISFESTNLFQSFSLADDRITMQVQSAEDVLPDIDADLGDFTETMVGVGSQKGNYAAKATDKFLNMIGAAGSEGTRYGSVVTDENGKQSYSLTADGKQALNEIATFPVVSGAFNATYDYLTEFNRAVETRALDDRLEGRNNAVWAHVIATYNRSDELFNGSGYKADLYGGVLGADARLSNGTLVGGALTVGTGDIESRGAVIGSKNDATFYGLSLYAEHEIGAMSVKGDVTYLRTENDIAGTFEGVNMGGSMDSDALSVGVRAEFAAYASDVFAVKPHIGLRYTNYSFDDYEGTEIDDINVIEAPVGVAFMGKVAAQGGWTVVPEFDLSVVPQLGDREATVVNAGAGVDQRVLEGALFNAKLGLGLTKDNFSFGANYQRGEGGYGRSNNAFQAYARWLF